jgi:hypothetical protein
MQIDVLTFGDDGNDVQVRVDEDDTIILAVRPGDDEACSTPPAWRSRDLAVALAALERAPELDLPMIEL